MLTTLLRTLLALSLLAAAAPAETVRIGTEGKFPPYNYVDRGGTLRGFDIDVGNAICARAGLTCTWVLHEWETIIPGLNAGRYDAIMAGMAATPSRAKQVLFSIGYETGGAGARYLSRTDSASQEPLSALIGVQVSTIHEEYLQSQGARYKTYLTNEAVLEALWDGQIDYAFGSDSFMSGALISSGEVFSLGPFVIIDTGNTVVAFRKSDTALKAKFDAAITSLFNDGTMARLSTKWFAGGDGTY